MAGIRGSKRETLRDLWSTIYAIEIIYLATLNIHKEVLTLSAGILSALVLIGFAAITIIDVICLQFFE